jgi:polysaccharide chain length determinant protein (PEP-CTERM system associated)
MWEILGQLVGYIWGVWRYRWVALILAWVVSVAGWLWVAQLPDQFEASARVNVDSNTVLRPLLRGLAIQPDINQRIELLTKTLLSRPNLEKLMRMADLDLQVKGDTQKDRLLEQLSENISLSGSRQNSSLYTVSFIHQDRDVAKRVVESLLTVFIESTLGDKREDSADAQTFLDQQITDYEKRLSDAENRLAEFKQKHVDVLPGDGGGYYEKLARLREEQKAAHLQLKEAQNRRDELHRQMEGEEPVFLAGSINDIPAISLLDTRIQSLKSRLDGLLTQYTEKHPEVVQIQKVITDLEAEKQQELENTLTAASGPDYSGIQSSPVYQQMRSMLAETEARVAELNVRVGEYDVRVQELESKVNNVPEIEAQLKQLNRDYGVIQQQHTSLLTRRESARISEDVEQNASDVSFRVIDPPFVPQKPNAPNKMLLNAGIFAASLGLGAGIALIIALFHPVILDKRSLSNHTGLPVLGSVTFVASVDQQKRNMMRFWQFSLSFMALLIAFVGVSFVPQWV